MVMVAGKEESFHHQNNMDLKVLETKDQLFPDVHGGATSIVISLVIVKAEKDLDCLYLDFVRPFVCDQSCVITVLFNRGCSLRHHIDIFEVCSTFSKEQIYQHGIEMSSCFSMLLRSHITDVQGRSFFTYWE